MNGKPLIRHAVDHALKDWGASTVSIIVAPENARAILSLCQPEYNYIVQPGPSGVVDAISRGLPFSDGEWTLILCADNTFTLDGESIQLPPKHSCFGTRKLSPEDARRFTRFKLRKPIDVTTFKDDTPQFLQHGVHIIEADAQGVDVVGDGVWIGPLLLRTEMIAQALMSRPNTVVELMRLATNDGITLQPFKMRCEDLGMPEELQ